MRYNDITAMIGVFVAAVCFAAGAVIYAVLLIFFSIMLTGA